MKHQLLSLLALVLLAVGTAGAETEVAQAPPALGQIVMPSMEPPLEGQPAPAPPRPTPGKPVEIQTLPPVPAKPQLEQTAAPPPAAPSCAGSPCPADPPTPMVKLRVRVPATAAAGQEIEYRLCVENTSRADAHHVTIRNPLPAHARLVRATPEPSLRDPELVWHLGTLKACACRDIVLVLAATGTGDVRNCARVQFEHGQCVTTCLARPQLAVRCLGSTTAILYDNLSYQIEVRNTGQAPAAAVTVVDTLPDGLEHASGKTTLTWDLGTLAPGAARTVEVQAIAKKAGRLCSSIAATAAGDMHAAAEHCVAIGEAKIELTMQGPERRFLTSPATYTLTVNNPGSVPASNVTVTNLVPANAAFVGATPGGQWTGTQLQWPVGTLPPGGHRSFQITLKASGEGEVINRATAAADRGLTATAEARTLFEGATGLTADVDGKDNPLEVGAETTYTVRVMNQGALVVNDVAVYANVPEQLQVLSARGPTAHKTEGQQVIFEPLPGVDPQQEARYEIIVKALRPGDVRFKVDITARQLPAGPVHREESTTIYADSNGGPAAPPGTPPTTVEPPPATRLEPPQAVP